MPRVHRAVLCPLSALTAALVGGADAGNQLAASSVCEFSCSCCRSSTALAADALCTYLTADGGALQDFCCKADGVTALQVGLSSSNDAVVCAALRVCGSIVQSLITHQQWPAQRSRGQSTCGGLQSLQPSQLQLPQPQTPGRQATEWLHAGELPAFAPSSSSTSTPAATSARLNSAALAAKMLSALTAHVAGAAQGPDVRVAALLELQQVALQLAADAEALCGRSCDQQKQLANEPASPAANSSCRQQATTSGSLEWLPGVVGACMAALAGAEPSLRRAASQALAAVLVLQDAVGGGG